MRKGAYYYFFPTYKQGGKILWFGMDRDGFKFLDHIPEEMREKTNNTEMRIELKNGSLIQVVGSDNIDSIVGTNPVGCVFSEYALQSPLGWDFVSPILAENGGWALFNYTPRGPNHGKVLWDKALSNPRWFTELLTVDDTKRPDGTPVIGPDIIQNERDDGKSEEFIQQEYWCSFKSGAPGAYYAHEIRKAEKENRIREVPYDEHARVNTAWDLGVDDSTSIWFWQNTGREIHLIDYYENSGEGLEFYAHILEEKAEEGNWLYGRHLAPHDIRVRELGTGKSRLEKAREFGLKFEVIDRPESKEDAIEAVRGIFPICYFDISKCSRGIDALTFYKKEYDPLNLVFKMRPTRDWATHGADAFSSLALGYNVRRKWSNLRNAV
jgi:hypothetical protein